MEQTNNLLTRFIKFSVTIIHIVNKLPNTLAGKAIGGQIVRSATSIGANYHEAQDAMSKADFLKGITISLKEARETAYWLTLIVESNMANNLQIGEIQKECGEIVAILTSSVKKLKINKL